jgi:hypothetical protein
VYVPNSEGLITCSSDVQRQEKKSVLGLGGRKKSPFLYLLGFNRMDGAHVYSREQIFFNQSFDLNADLFWKRLHRHEMFTTYLCIL